MNTLQDRIGEDFEPIENGRMVRFEGTEASFLDFEGQVVGRRKREWGKGEDCLAIVVYRTRDLRIHGKPWSPSRDRGVFFVRPNEVRPIY